MMRKVQGTRSGYGSSVPAITQEIFKCVSSVAGVGLQDLANWLGQSNIGKQLNLTNQNIYSEADTYNGTFLQKIVWRKMESQHYHSDDDVSVIIDSDSDILETIEKANIVEFFNDDSSTLAGFKEELST